MQLTKAGFASEGGKAVAMARTNKDVDAAWDAKFEQLKKCELTASHAQHVT